MTSDSVSKIPLKVSLITATCNSSLSVNECLDSVFIQTHKNIEHILIDCKSTDGTLDLISKSRSICSVLISELDDGIYDALNKGIEKASGDVIGFLHSDDFFADKEVLSWINNTFKDPAILAVYGDLIYVEKMKLNSIKRRWVSGDFSPFKLKKGWMPPHPTVFFRRSIYDEFGAFDKSYRISADYDFLLRVLRKLEPNHVAYIPKVLVKMRIGGISNRSLKHLLRKSWEDYQIIRKHKIGGLGTLLQKNFSKLPQFFSKK